MMITNLLALAILSPQAQQGANEPKVILSLPRVPEVLGKPLTEGGTAIRTFFGKDQDWKEIDHPGGMYFSLVVPNQPKPESDLKEGRLPWMMYQVTSGPTRGRGQIIHSVSVTWVGATKWTGALQAVGLDPAGVKTVAAKPMQGTQKATKLTGIKGLPTEATATVYEIVGGGKTFFSLNFHVDISKPN